ncbi:MAG: AAA family ATPase [Acidimicrobiia bacterium]
MSDRPTTLGDLRASGWEPRTVKAEVRSNLIDRIRAGRPLVDGIVGYEDTVVPALERAILAGHDIILLGERGQGKTRLIRGLVGLLDEAIPAIDGTETNDDPYAPSSAAGRRILAEQGDDAPIRWLAPEDRFSEKLATPDIAVADLIGDLDPIKVAEGRYLTDEETIHHGLVPRTNRGIVSINELPDLPPRIQVALLNVLEERDVQIRGHLVRLELDLLLVATANPEDYTNRGRIITPLKDRFGSEVRTHYPRTAEHEITIVGQELTPPPADVVWDLPQVMREVVVALTERARTSSHVNHRSGVSVRFSIANAETLIASAIRRALRTGESPAVPRVADLPSLVQSSMGRLEFEVFEEGREEELLRRMVSEAVLDVFRDRLGTADLSGVLAAFDAGVEVETGDLVPSEQVVADAGDVPDLADLLRRLDLAEESPAHVACGLEFVMEGLHLTRRLNKDATLSGGTVYAG